jgi:hypothetical protein
VCWRVGSSWIVGCHGITDSARVVLGHDNHGWPRDLLWAWFSICNGSMSSAHKLRVVADGEQLHLALRNCCVWPHASVSGHVLWYLQDWLMCSGVALLCRCEVERVGQSPASVSRSRRRQHFRSRSLPWKRRQGLLSSCGVLLRKLHLGFSSTRPGSLLFATLLRRVSGSPRVDLQ